MQTKLETLERKLNALEIVALIAMRRLAANDSDADTTEILEQLDLLAARSADQAEEQMYALARHIVRLSSWV